MTYRIRIDYDDTCLVKKKTRKLEDLDRAMDMVKRKMRGGR